MNRQEVRARERKAASPGGVPRGWRVGTPGAGQQWYFAALPTEAKLVCWSLLTGAEGKEPTSWTATHQAAGNGLTYSSHETAAGKAAGKMGSPPDRGPSDFLSFFQDPPVFFSDQRDGLNGETRNHHPGSLKPLVVAPTSAVPPGMWYFFHRQKLI